MLTVESAVDLFPMAFRAVAFVERGARRTAVGQFETFDVLTGIGDNSNNDPTERGSAQKLAQSAQYTEHGPKIHEHGFAPHWSSTVEP